MINIEKAITQFKKYTTNYDLSNQQILNKQEHSLRVMEISRNIAKDLNLSEEEINLATLIGLLHDIGRFEQFTKYGTFRDIDSVDHGDLGVKILEENNFIREFIEDDKYDNIIKKAIKNHNKYAIEDGLNEQELLFAKLIRDSDKIDILYEAETIFYEGKEEEISKSIINSYAEEQIRSKKAILRKEGYIAEGINKVLGVLSFIYDLNFNYSFKYIKQKNQINKILDKFEFTDKETKEKMQVIRDEISNYIEDNSK